MRQVTHYCGKLLRAEKSLVVRLAYNVTRACEWREHGAYLSAVWMTIVFNL